MGRLFARLFCVAVSELYLFDFFDGSTGSTRLAKTFDDLRGRAEPGGLRADSRSLIATADGGGWATDPWSQAQGRNRGLLVLRPGDGATTSETARDSRRLTGTLAGIVDHLADGNPTGCTVFAGLPTDSAELLTRADVTLLAVGLEGKSSLTDTLQFYAPFFRPSSLVVDLSSTQSAALDALREAVPSSVGILGAHPLFGPAVSDLTGLIVAVVDAPDGRPTSLWRDWFLDQLARFRLIVTPTTAGEHDDSMAFVQALTHFALLSYAYTFVRLNRDPSDLLSVRTPVFEPLLYLAARVAHLARTSPDTYRSIQTHSARPDARVAFLESARELLDAIELSQAENAAGRGDGSPSDPLTSLLIRYGAPWSPDQRDRRDRQRGEHFLEMGARLVDGLNQLRQEVVTAAGQVRAIEERRSGQPPRVHVGLVVLDLLDPGKQDIASRIRLRPINLRLGSVQGGEASLSESHHDLVIPLARARVLSDAELFDWLLEKGELVEERSCPLLVPTWFDRSVLVKLIKGLTDVESPGTSRIWDVAIEDVEGQSSSATGQKPARVTLKIVLHPAEVVAMRQTVQKLAVTDLSTSIRDLDLALERIHRHVAAITDEESQRTLAREKDQLKHQRKKLVDRRTADVDREVRRRSRNRVQSIYQAGINWLTQRGCSPLH